MENKGHFCYGCDEHFHDSNPSTVYHKGCKGTKSLGACIDRKEFGEYHPYNLEEDKTKWELIQIINDNAEEIITAFERLEGRRHCTPKEIENWLINDISPVINKLREKTKFRKWVIKK